MYMGTYLHKQSTGKFYFPVLCVYKKFTLKSFRICYNSSVQNNMRYMI